MGKEAAQIIFSHLQDKEVKKMISAMSRVEKAPVNLVKEILDDFYSELNEEKEILFSENKDKNFLINTLGEDRARKFLGKISGDIKSEHQLDSLKSVDARSLVNFLLNEHPQTIALVMAHLYPDKKVEVLKMLPERLQSDVIIRVANIDYISPELLDQLNQVLKEEFLVSNTNEETQFSGLDHIINMFNLMDKETEVKIFIRSRRESSEPCK